MQKVEEQVKDSQKQSKKLQIAPINSIKKYLLRMVQNQYKLNLSDQEAFRWKLRKKNDNQQLSSFKLLKTNSILDDLLLVQQVGIQDLKSIEFPVLKYKTKQLTQFSILILRSNKYFLDEFKDEILLRKLITQISLNYNIVSYHNFSHAFSLSLVLFQCFQIHDQLRDLFTPEDQFYAILAGLAHDLNHPGTNNLYEVKKKSKLALEANNQSVLEKFHVRQLWNILQKNPNIDFLKKVPNPTKIKQRITNLILLTDVAQHFKNLDKLKALKFECESQDNLPLKSPQNSDFLLGQLFHACDISNPCLDFDNYITWAALLSYQFNQQTKLEKFNNLEVTQMLRYKDLKTFYNGQLGFINFMVLPLWKQIASICGKLHIFTDNINSNTKTLHQMIQNVNEQEKIIKNKQLQQ